MIKHYRGTFMWYGEEHKLSTKASDPKVAFIRMTKVLAKKLQRRYSAVGAYFACGENKYIIEEVSDGRKEQEATNQAGDIQREGSPSTDRSI